MTVRKRRNRKIKKQGAKSNISNKILLIQIGKKNVLFKMGILGLPFVAIGSLHEAIQRIHVLTYSLNNRHALKRNCITFLCE